MCRGTQAAPAIFILSIAILSMPMPGIFILSIAMPLPIPPDVAGAIIAPSIGIAPPSIDIIFSIIDIILSNLSFLFIPPPEVSEEPPLIEAPLFFILFMPMPPIFVLSMSMPLPIPLDVAGVIDAPSVGIAPPFIDIIVSIIDIILSILSILSIPPPGVFGEPPLIDAPPIFIFPLPAIFPDFWLEFAIPWSEFVVPWSEFVVPWSGFVVPWSEFGIPTVPAAGACPGMAIPAESAGAPFLLPSAVSNLATFSRIAARSCDSAGSPDGESAVDGWEPGAAATWAA
jgi:hypothetical protein